MTCSVSDCNDPVHCKGMCQLHYVRNRRGSPPLSAPRKKRGEGYIQRGYHVVQKNGKGIPVHRTVMEALIGRPLLPEENVHHVNGIRDDNRPENLELWTKSQPAGQRVQDKVNWAREILLLYGADDVFVCPHCGRFGNVVPSHPH